jgi:hypothetical protein
MRNEVAIQVKYWARFLGVIAIIGWDIEMKPTIPPFLFWSLLIICIYFFFRFMFVAINHYSWTKKKFQYLQNLLNKH